MKQWTSESANQWIKEPTSQPLIQWSNESLKQWTNEPLNQWTNGSINERMNEWTNGVGGWMAGWLDGWMDEGLLFFIELLLHSSTSSLRHFFSQLLLFSGQPLFWATSALSFLPATSSADSATPFFSPCAASTVRFAMSSCNSGKNKKSSTLVKTTCRATVTMRLATSSCNPPFHVRQTAMRACSRLWQNALTQLHAAKHEWCCDAPGRDCSWRLINALWQLHDG